MNLLQIENLSVKFQSTQGTIDAVSNVSFAVKPGEIRGIIGESGSGKSVLSLALLGLLDEKAQVQYDYFSFNNESLSELSQHQRIKKLRKNISIIFQDPSESLNPTLTLKSQLRETIALHNDGAGSDFITEESARLLSDVGLSAHESLLPLYPHQLSDGVNQRIMIALALACSPKLLIADEATTNLDMTIQAQILQLLTGLSRDRNMAVVMITHDFAILAEATQSTSVMYCGYLLETGKTAELLHSPKHPYTQSLVNSVPQLGTAVKSHSHLYALPGSIPPADQIPVGCPLGPRCPRAGKPCVKLPPVQGDDEHKFRCHFPLGER
ncbi:MAG TPA: ABC transporter ATP-binding protein [Aeromonadales bacterium]|nr:ABC transporter ATP-binding protein [Aeromonadales bacterium]